MRKGNDLMRSFQKRRAGSMSSLEIGGIDEISVFARPIILAKSGAIRGLQASQ